MSSNDKQNATGERRQHSRYNIPVIIDAPGLSDLPLVPEDVSIGGFRVIVPEKPSVGTILECSIQIYEDRFDNCTSRVAWTGKNRETPGTWVIGMCVDHHSQDVARLLQKMKELAKQMQGD